VAGIPVFTCYARHSPAVVSRSSRVRLLVVALASSVLAVVSSSAQSPALAGASGEAHPPYVHGLITAPGGPNLVDRSGRVVIFHGVNAVYKHAPYVLYPDKGKPWNFDASDARLMQSLGFNVVRLGILWEGLEPGTLGPNNPSVCTPGAPGNPHQFNRTVALDYLHKVAETVDLLGRYHIYTLLDMHEDVYSQAFRGEGAPAWAVCTDGIPIQPYGGRWSNNYRNPALAAAERNFYSNDVVGNLQGQFDLVWATVAHYFRHNPWILGYDPLNEPYSSVLRSVLRGHSRENIAMNQECMYTGTAHPGQTIPGRTISCPSDDPKEGVIPTIRAQDPSHPIFREPDIMSVQNLPTSIGPMPYRNLVLNFHDYCRYRSPVTGNPTNLRACVAEEHQTIVYRVDEAHFEGYRDDEPGGLPVFMSEFGATQSTALLSRLTDLANKNSFGWIYWAWKYYDDPTGSAAEAMVSRRGRLLPNGRVLAQTYPLAVAGTQLRMSYYTRTADFSLSYRPDRRSSARTLISVPVPYHYPKGYCIRVSGASVVSKSGASRVELVNHTRADRVVVGIRPGSC
jgi:endoglycosylceramidase